VKKKLFLVIGGVIACILLLFVVFFIKSAHTPSVEEMADNEVSTSDEIAADNETTANNETTTASETTSNNDATADNNASVGNETTAEDEGPDDFPPLVMYNDILYIIVGRRGFHLSSSDLDALVELGEIQSTTDSVPTENFQANDAIEGCKIYSLPGKDDYIFVLYEDGYVSYEKLSE